MDPDTRVLQASYESELVSTHDLLFAGKVDAKTRRRKSPFSNTMVLPGFNIYEALKIDEPKKLAWKEHLFDLRARHLEQAVLDGADLTKADLTGAQMTGVSLRHAKLPGASLADTQLQGAALYRAELHGALLDHAQLQGASLSGAELQGAWLDSVAFLWRAQWGKIDQERLGAVRLKDATWKPIWRKSDISDPIEWTAKAYAELRGSINSIPEGGRREAALRRIETLDCAKFKALASCDPAAYAKALATELQSLICAVDVDNAIYILRGVIERERPIKFDGAPALVDFIISKDCPVSTSLTDDDKAKLQNAKQEGNRHENRTPRHPPAHYRPDHRCDQARRGGVPLEMIATDEQPHDHYNLSVRLLDNHLRMLEPSTHRDSSYLQFSRGNCTIVEIEIRDAGAARTSLRDFSLRRLESIPDCAGLLRSIVRRQTFLAGLY